MKHKVVLSTDIGSDIDDALALDLLVKSDDVDLQAVYTTNGDLDARSRIARALLDLSGNDAPVYMGESESLSGKPEPYRTYLERANIHPHYLKPTLEQLGIRPDGVTDLVHRMRKDNPVILSIAPLTNIARMLQLAPDLNGPKTRLYLMGGRSGKPEHNFRFDLEAARCVLGSGIDMTIVPADVCERYKKPSASFRNLESDSGLYIGQMLHNWHTYQMWRAMIGSYASSDITVMEAQAKEGFPRYISNLVYALSDPSFMSQHPDDYHSTFLSFMNLLRNHSEPEGINNIYSRIIGELPTETAVHDAYVPYVLLHPDKVLTRKVSVELTDDSWMKVRKGKPHTLVTDLDYDNFKFFLGRIM